MKHPIEIVLTIYRGVPNKDSLEHILDQISKGYQSGIGDPEGINWEVEITPYEYREKLVKDDD